MTNTTYQVGQLVDVLPRTWPGMNREGGRAWVTKIIYEGTDKILNLEVKYIINSGCETVDADFVQSVEAVSTLRPKRNSTRSSSELKGVFGKENEQTIARVNSSTKKKKMRTPLKDKNTKNFLNAMQSISLHSETPKSKGIETKKPQVVRRISEEDKKVTMEQFDKPVVTPTLPRMVELQKSKSNLNIPLKERETTTDKQQVARPKETQKESSARLDCQKVDQKKGIVEVKKKDLDGIPSEIIIKSFDEKKSSNASTPTTIGTTKKCPPNSDISVLTEERGMTRILQTKTNLLDQKPIKKFQLPQGTKKSSSSGNNGIHHQQQQQQVKRKEPTTINATKSSRIKTSTDNYVVTLRDLDNKAVNEAREFRTQVMDDQVVLLERLKTTLDRLESFRTYFSDVLNEHDDIIEENNILNEFNAVLKRKNVTNINFTQTDVDGFITFLLEVGSVYRIGTSIYRI